MAISPWENELNLMSPDGIFRAEIADAGEIAMGAPTSGTLVINNEIKISSCNPSAVWSSNSRYLAIPQWTDKKMQKLIVIDAKTGKLTISNKTFNVLVLNRFEDNIINGIDSPNTKNEEFTIDFTKMDKNT